MRKDIINKYKGVLLFTIGSLLIILSLILLLYDRIGLQYNKVISEVNYLIDNSGLLDNDDLDTSEEILVDTEFIEEEIPSEPGTSSEYKPPSKPLPKKEYIGYIDIPKINLKSGLVAKNSYYNNVNRNIQIMSISDFPDVDKGNLILASHSGASNVSYFKNLYLLKVLDKVTITYNNNYYNYTIKSIYKEPKDGSVNIKRDTEKTTLTLITCSYKDKAHQTIYICELDSVKEVK